MATWREIQLRADAKLFARQGDPAVYTPLSGDPVSLTVLVDKDFAVLDEEGGVAEHMTVIRYRLAELAGHEIGANLVVAGATYSLGKTLTDDGFIRTVQAHT